jgi:hypothetical protein
MHRTLRVIIDTADSRLLWTYSWISLGEASSEDRLGYYTLFNFLQIPHVCKVGRGSDHIQHFTQMKRSRKYLASAKRRKHVWSRP